MYLAETDFVKYGSTLEPLNEDELFRKKPCLLEEQTVKDKQGRRRFHGAFTGGFSAGYFNTVGSTTGWKPSSFKSSRSKKEEVAIQKPENFMDEEDLGEFGIAPMILKTRENYCNERKNSLNSLRCNIQCENNLGEFVVKNYLRLVRETIGITLLKKMGWKLGQGVGPRVNKKERKINSKLRKKIYGCNLPPGFFENKDDSDSNSELEDIKFAPADCTPISFTLKPNFFGIGYQKLQKNYVLDSDTRIENELFKDQLINKKYLNKGHGFGVGVFEDEDEDIYSKDDADQYDFFLSHESQNQEETKSQNIVKAGVIAGFTPELNKSKSKHYQLPNLPSNLSLYYKLNISNDYKSDKKNYESNEKCDWDESGNNLKINNKINNQSQNVKPFISTTIKKFLVASEPEDLSNPLATVNKFTGKDEDCIRAAKLKMFGPLTRKIEEWAPCSLLSKRFNIPEPKHFCQNIVKEKTNILFDTVTSNKVLMETNQDDTEKMEDSSFCNQIGLDKKNNTNLLKIDLFKEIFLTSDETSENENSFNLKEDKSEDLLFEEKIINSKRNTSPPRGIFEYINTKKKSAEISSEIFNNANCSENNDRVLAPDAFNDLFYGPKIPDAIAEKTEKVLQESVWTTKTLKTQHKKKSKKHKKSSHKTKHKHKNKYKKN